MLIKAGLQQKDRRSLSMLTLPPIHLTQAVQKVQKLYIFQSYSYCVTTENLLEQLEQNHITRKYEDLTHYETVQPPIMNGETQTISKY